MEKYYLYYIHDDGDGMVLTAFHQEDDGMHTKWTPHHMLSGLFEMVAWNNIEALERLRDKMMAEDPTHNIHIARWVSLDQICSNQHSDPYEIA